jgi:hypothetical protein
VPEIVGVEVAEALVIRPGDKLLVRVDVHTSRERAMDLRDELKERLSEVEVCVIAAEQLAVFRG